MVLSINRYREILSAADIKQTDVTPAELVEYFSGDTPTGDTTTLARVLENPWLLLHELVEIKALKNMGHLITRDLVWNQKSDVYEAHMIATEKEFEIASQFGADDWIGKRMVAVESWLEDSEMPSMVRKRCLNLLSRHS